jgi:hypothetical protein
MKQFKSNKDYFTWYNSNKDNLKVTSIKLDTNGLIKIDYQRKVKRKYERKTKENI